MPESKDKLPAIDTEKLYTLKQKQSDNNASFDI